MAAGLCLYAVCAAALVVASSCCRTRAAGALLNWFPRRRNDCLTDAALKEQAVQMHSNLALEYESTFTSEKRPLCFIDVYCDLRSQRDASRKLAVSDTTNSTEWQ